MLLTPVMESTTTDEGSMHKYIFILLKFYVNKFYTWTLGVSPICVFSMTTNYLNPKMFVSGDKDQTYRYCMCKYKN